MTNQFTENVLINCDCDETQLRVQGTSGQTHPLQEWVDSEGQVLARITAEGQLETSGLDFGDGTLEVNTVDINGGAIDGTVIGAATPATARFTTVTAANGLILGSSLRQVHILDPSQAGIRLWCNGGSGKAWGIASHSSGTLFIQDDTDGSPALQLTDTLFALFGANLSLGATSAGTGATNTLVITDGTPPSSTPAGAAQLYADTVSSTVEMRVRDSAGNVTTLSPHNPQLVDASDRISDWVHKEENPHLGYRMEVDLYGVVEALEKLTGQKFIYVEAMDDDEIKSWEASEATNAAEREQEIHAWEAEATKARPRPEAYQRRAEPERFARVRERVRQLK